MKRPSLDSILLASTDPKRLHDWLAKLDDRDGSLFATAIDPDGNYVQIIELSDEERVAMEKA